MPYIEGADKNFGEIFFFFFLGLLDALVYGLCHRVALRLDSYLEFLSRGTR